jgi:hypothetical protein
MDRDATNVYMYSPKIGAGMYDPVAGRLLPDALLHERLLAAKQLHGQFIIGGLEQRLQVVLEETLLLSLARRTGSVGPRHGPTRAPVTRTTRTARHNVRRPRLLLRCSVQADVVAPKVHLQSQQQ